MREKYFEDLGLDDGDDILSKFNINVGEILEESELHDNNKNDDESDSENK
jgi:hypothetical protein